MKKNYNKPQIVFESFELSQSIAAGCGMVLPFSREACSIEITDARGGVFTIFIRDGICEDTNPDMYLCYDVPTQEQGVFQS